MNDKKKGNMTILENFGCSCTTLKPENDTQQNRYIIGSKEIASGTVPIVSARLSFKDKLGELQCRIGSFRNNYTIEPGLYGIGNPNEDSDVLVSANYKMSFDKLRKELHGIDAWILVLDTKGINVWCAAGKGTFGTEELIKRIESCNIHNIVNHKRVIVPQLGAPGINASAVKRGTGFIVKYGPVLAKDISAYLKNNYIADEDMRKIPFSILDRLVLTPIELRPALKYYVLFTLSMLIFLGINPNGFEIFNALSMSKDFLLLGFLAIIGGSVLTPLLLPILPTPSFALKGWFMGILTTAVPLATGFSFLNGILITIAAMILFPVFSSYLALQFTGCSTYTGISGVNKELKISLPIYISLTAISVILLIIHKIVSWSTV